MFTTLLQHNRFNSSIYSVRNSSFINQSRFHRDFLPISFTSKIKEESTTPYLDKITDKYAENEDKTPSEKLRRGYKSFLVGLALYPTRLAALRIFSNVISGGINRKEGLELAAIATILGMTEVLSKKFRNNQRSNIKEFFAKRCEEDDINSELIFNDELLNSNGITIGSTSVHNGKVELNPVILDLFSFTNLGKSLIINHELRHVKQISLMARSPGGIERVNLILLKDFIKSLSLQDKTDFLGAQQEVESDNLPDKYKNEKVRINDKEVELPTFINIIASLIKNDDIPMDKMPILFDTSYYERERELKGPLTPQEAEQVERFFEAFENYGHKGIFGHFKYLNNPLEKDAWNHSRKKNKS